MRALVWIALNALRWLTVVAVIAWANPQPLHIKAEAPTQTPEVRTRTIQLAACPPWAMRIGKWAGANVCASYPSSKASYLHQRRTK